MIGIGIDQVEVERIRGLYARRCQRFLSRIYTQGERDYCLAQADPFPGLAARFAAKEAVLKSLGVGLGAFGLREVEIYRQASGQPGVKLHGRADQLAQSMGVRQIMLTISHTRDLAVAVAVAL